MVILATEMVGLEPRLVVRLLYTASLAFFFVVMFGWPALQKFLSGSVLVIDTEETQPQRYPAITVCPSAAQTNSKLEDETVKVVCNVDFGLFGSTKRVPKREVLQHVGRAEEGVR